MQRKFLVNLILLVVINLLVKPLAIFGIDAEVQNRIGYADYGLYFSLFNFTYLFNILLDVGITNFNIKNVAQHPRLSRRYIGKLFSLRIVLFGFYCVIVLLLGGIIGFKHSQIFLLFLLIVNQFLLGLIQFFRSYLSGMLFFLSDAFFSIFDKLLLIFICGYFLYFNLDSPFSVYHFVFSQMVAYLVSITAIVFVLIRKIGFQKFKISSYFSIAILKKSLPYAFLILAMTIYTRIDAVLLERIHPNGAYETGIYAQSYRILDAFVMFTMLFNTLLFPIFSTQLAKKETIQPLLLMASKLIFVLSISVVVGCVFFAEPILHLFYTNLQANSVLVFQLLILSFIPISSIQIFGTLHTAEGNLRFLSIVSSVGIGVSLVLNLVFIPIYGVIGTAVICLITHTIIALSQLVYTTVYFHFQIAWKVIGSVFIFGAILLISCYSFSLFHLSFGLNCILFCGEALLLAFLFKLISVKEVVSLFKK